MDINIKKIPVFVFPTSLKFHLGARQTHKQLLTLYNPYDFAVRFKVLSTAPNKYSVIDPDGSIGPRACVDIVIRHTMPMPNNCGGVDKFRISMQDHTTRQVIGKRDIEARLLPGEPDFNSQDGGDNFHSLPQGERGPEDHKSMQYPLHSYRNMSQHNTPNYMAIILGLVCSVALLWPTQQEPLAESHFIPSYLYISNTIKLVFAYVLGLITMVIFKA